MDNYYLCKLGICIYRCGKSEISAGAEISDLACWWLPPPNPFFADYICGCAPFRRFFQNTLSGNRGQFPQNLVGTLPMFLLPTQYLLFRRYAKVEQSLTFGFSIFRTHIDSFLPPEAATIWWGSNRPPPL